MLKIWNGGDFRRLMKTPHKIPGLIARNLKYSHQRIAYGYCDKDCWDIDQWFTDIMPSMLQQLKENTNRDSVVCGAESSDACNEEWDNILDEMIFLFREMNEETCQKQNPYEKEYLELLNGLGEKNALLDGKVQLVNEELKKMYFEREVELSDYRKSCKDKALALFSKWFYYLWD